MHTALRVQAQTRADPPPPFVIVPHWRTDERLAAYGKRGGIYPRRDDGTPDSYAGQTIHKRYTKAALATRHCRTGNQSERLQGVSRGMRGR